jgi:hypothetical protein
MAGLIDYAGLFPPAGLDLPSAVAAYYAYRRGRLAWVLGRFVIGAARLDELSAVSGPVLPSGPGAVPWQVSALLGEDLAAGLASIEAFNARHAQSRRGRAVVDAVEVKVSAPGDVARVAAVLAPALRAAYEVPLDGDLDPVVEAIGCAGGVAKARLGGVVPAAIPPVERVAAWLWSAARRGVPIKATAGLHHPVRGEYPLTYESDAPRAVMHGFVNVFLAACLTERAVAAGERIGVPSLVREVLAETDERAFTWDEGAVRWRDVTIEADAIEQTRGRFALSCGSCSFEGPIEGLRLEA